MAISDWYPVPLPFEVVRYERGPDDGRALTITSVIRDDHALRVHYEIVPPLPNPMFGPFGEANDDLGNRYDDCGGAYDGESTKGRTEGDLSFPLPAPKAVQLTLRIAWVWDAWEGGSHELRIQLSATPNLS